MGQLKQILAFTNLVVGTPVTVAHKLNWNGNPVKPDVASLDVPGFAVTATTASVTITRVDGPAAVNMLIESWHTYEREFGSAQVVALTPQPFVMQAAGAGGSGDFLGAKKTTGFETTTGVLTIPARDLLIVQMEVQFYGLPGIVGLKFNGDGGNNYYTRYISSVPGGAVLVNNEDLSTNLLRSAGVDTGLGRSVLYAITNNAASEKIATVSTLAGSGAANTAPLLQWGGGGWVNTTDQITSIEMIEDGGGTFEGGFAVWGHNLS